MALPGVLNLYQVSKQQPDDKIFQVLLILNVRDKNCMDTMKTVNLRYLLSLVFHSQDVQGGCHY